VGPGLNRSCQSARPASFKIFLFLESLGKVSVVVQDLQDWESFWPAEMKFFLFDDGLGIDKKYAAV
jgi:hypothetical protein